MVEPLSAESEGEGVRSKRLRALIRYWNGKRGDRPMPLRGQIDPIEIPRLLPIILIADLTPAGPSMRLMGTEATAAYGQEIRGRMVGEIEFGEFTPFWRDAFALVAKSTAPVSAGGAFRNANQRYSVEMVLTPLTDDGASISRIFGGVLIRPLVHGVTTVSLVQRTYTAPVADYMNDDNERAECSGR